MTVEASRPRPSREPRRLVFSPHLDDAVFSSGQWLAAHPGSRVATLFAGTPPDAQRRTDWDARCGFDSAGAAMAARRREDAAALEKLGALPVWLDFCDRQYDTGIDAPELGRALGELLRQALPHELLLPLGLFHSDHRLAHDAIVLALQHGPRVDSVVAYEDAPYRALPGLLQERLAELAAAGVRATPIPAAPDALERKRQAVACYASQVQTFGPGGLDDLWRAERFWRLEGGVFGGPTP